ncbi:MAG: helix-turn-helix domain-containing protein, partial [Thermocrispum sp.]
MNREPSDDTARPPRVLLTVEDAAQRLSIGRTTMYALIRDGHVRT